MGFQCQSCHLSATQAYLQIILGGGTGGLCLYYADSVCSFNHVYCHSILLLFLQDVKQKLLMLEKSVHYTKNNIPPHLPTVSTSAASDE